MNAILSRIDELRNKKGLSKYELAKSIGVSNNTVYDWYRIGAVPSLENIQRICAVFNITIEQFFNENGTKRLTDEENRLLQEWMLLGDLERQAILKTIQAFKSLKK